VVRRGTASATQTMTGGPPPCLIVAPDLLCSLKAFALRSTRHPLSNHPHKPLPPMVPKSLVDPCLGDTPRRRTGIGSREPRTSRPQDLKRPSGDLPGASTPSPRGSAEETPAASTPSPQRSAGASDGRFNPHCLGSVDQGDGLLVQTPSRTCPRRMQLWAFDARLGAPCGDQWASPGRRQLLPYITQLEGAGA